MPLIRLLCFTLCLSAFTNLHAEETDQFTLPPNALYDLGPSTSKRLYDVIESVLTQINNETQMLALRAKHSRHAAKQLALRSKDTYIADLLYARTGPGYPRWLRNNYLPPHEAPEQFKERRPWKTIYWLVFSQSPLFVIGLSPTVNMYNYHFGTDKYGHFFMQGHTYYKIYSYLLAHGKSPKQAHAAMILYGQILEQTYLGTLINGVYSNADLSANYAGWKFYMNLTHSIKMGDKTLPPLLVRKDGKWEFAQHVNKDNLLKTYLSDNLNEAWNPSRYSFMRGQIRKHIKERCSTWIQREGITQPLVEAKLKEVTSWHGEDYGHWLPKDNTVTLNTCFGGK